MRKPELNEVVDYFFLKLQDMEQARHEAEGFFNYYSSVGWYVGKKPMKAWKFAVLNWIRNMKKYNSNGQQRTVSDLRNLFQ